MISLFFSFASRYATSRKLHATLSILAEELCPVRTGKASWFLGRLAAAVLSAKTEDKNEREIDEVIKKQRETKKQELRSDHLSYLSKSKEK